MAGRVEIPGSTPRPPAESAETSAIPNDEQLSASIILQSPSQDDVAAVEAFAREFGLRVTEADAAKRTVKVSGTPQQLGEAFGVKLAKAGGYVTYQGPLSVPEDLAGLVMAVLGLDNRPVAHSHS